MLLYLFTTLHHLPRLLAGPFTVAVALLLTYGLSATREES
jgi:hypothetical protein